MGRNLLDLADEILLMILKKLNVVEALVEQSGVHSRLYRLLFDQSYVRELDFIVKSWNGSFSLIDDRVIDRLCEDFIPQFSDKIVRLIGEPNCLERVLRSFDDTRALSSLSLLHFPSQALVRLCTENTRLIKLLNERVTSLTIQLADDDGNLLQMILSMSKHLLQLQLTFHQSNSIKDGHSRIPRKPWTNCSTLINLDIHLKDFEECLFFLDGRLPCLSHCSVYIEEITFSSSAVKNEGNLFQMKSFSLTSYVKTSSYDECVTPLIRRMSKLKELRLYLCVSKRETFNVVDGNALQKDLCVHLPDLKRFRFSIYTYLYLSEPTDSLPSSNQLQQSFFSYDLGEVQCYVYPSSSSKIYQCHIYSIPFSFQSFARLSSSFPVGLFTNVRTLLVNDCLP